MDYHEIKPPPSLEHLVRYFWVLDHDGTETFEYKLFAESCPGVVFFCRSGYGIVSGPTTEHRSFTIEGSFKMLGAYLFPHALTTLFNIPAHEVTGKQIRLPELDPTEADRLTDQIMNAVSDLKRVYYLSEYLIARLRTVTNIDRAIQHGVHRLMLSNGALNISELSAEVNLSPRQLERRFIDTVGLSPKLLSRLIRFQNSLRMPDQYEIRSLTDLALGAGYYDQSHFIRDFTAFSGISPKEYFRLASPRVADNFVQFSPRHFDS